MSQAIRKERPRKEIALVLHRRDGECVTDACGAYEVPLGWYTLSDAQSPRDGGVVATLRCFLWLPVAVDMKVYRIALLCFCLWQDVDIVKLKEIASLFVVLYCLKR